MTNAEAAEENRDERCVRRSGGVSVSQKSLLFKHSRSVLKTFSSQSF